MNLSSCTTFGISLNVTYKKNFETTNEMYLIELMHNWVDQFITKPKSLFIQKSG